jgi:predicted transcriptional regulator
MRGFGELEAVVMVRLWARTDPTAVREVFEELRDQREIAYTTVMSTMDNLHRKGWLDGGGKSDLVLTHFLAQMTDQESATLRTALQRLAGTEGQE